MKIRLNRLLVRLLTALGITLIAACGSVTERDSNTPKETPATVTPSQPPVPMPVTAPPPQVGTVANDQATTAESKVDKAAKAAPMATGLALRREAERAYAPFAPAPAYPMPQVREERERYNTIKDNPVHLAAETPVSTFSVDVDTASYSNVRRLLNEGRLPPQDAVRVEELVNYFPYDYKLPQDGKPFAVHTELSASPWNADKMLLRIGIKGQDLAKQSLPPANLVFLVDVSGSMGSPERLPLLQSALKLLVNEMAQNQRTQDRITLVTYAGNTAVRLPPTTLAERGRILAAIDSLNAGGGTNGASGIQLAYQMAQQGFIKGGINRILLATDGDFNVGITDTAQLKNLVEEKRKAGISLSTLGFGVGNYNDAMMKTLADAGDGKYSYIDNLMEGRKVLVEEMSSTLATIAKDVKIQVEFNPATVSEYRLIGYESRLLAREDFNNDKVDAGDIGAGHTVTALYEITPKGNAGLVDPLRYGSSLEAERRPISVSAELAFVKLRYKLPDAERSELMSIPVRRDTERAIAQTSPEFRFAASVAGFGQILRGGKYTGSWKFADARNLAASSMGADRFGYRGEFLRLIDLAASLSTQPVASRE